MKDGKTLERHFVDDRHSKNAATAPERKERMVVRQPTADGSVRYVVTKALLRRAAKAASRKNFEAA